MSTDNGRVTLTSFLSYYVMSAIISPLGIVSFAISERYDITLTHATATFSYLTTGVLIGSFLSMFINPIFGSKRVVLLGSLTLTLTVLMIRVVDSAWFLPPAFLISGTCCGLLLATAAIVLTDVYSEKFRAPALLATDSFYSLAGFMIAPFAGYIVVREMHWANVYLVAFLALIVIAGLAAVSSYPVHEEKKVPDQIEVDSRWPVGVFLISAGLFLYLICFVFLYTWVPAYAVQEFEASAETAGALVSLMFLGMFFGQIIVFFLALRVNIAVLITSIGIGVFVATFFVWNSPTLGMLNYSMLAVGLIGGGLLKTAISYGTQLADDPSPRLVGFLVFSTALGTSLSPALSAFIVEQVGIRALLMMVSVGYFLTMVLVASAIVVHIKSKPVAA